MDLDSAVESSAINADTSPEKADTLPQNENPCTPLEQTGEKQPPEDQTNEGCSSDVCLESNMTSTGPVQVSPTDEMRPPDFDALMSDLQDFSQLDPIAS